MVHEGSSSWQFALCAWSMHGIGFNRGHVLSMHGASIGYAMDDKMGFGKIPNAGSTSSHALPTQIVESTGSVMSPYMDFPQLLTMLLRMLNEGGIDDRLPIMRVGRGGCFSHVCLSLPLLDMQSTFTLKSRCCAAEWGGIDDRLTIMRAGNFSLLCHSHTCLRFRAWQQ